MSHGGSAFNTEWPEIFALFLLLAGIIIGVLSPNAWITYSIALVAGLFSGRWWVHGKWRGPGPYGLIIAGFILGYIIGTFRGSRVWTLVWFAVGFFGMIKIMKKGLFKDILY